MARSTDTAGVADLATLGRLPADGDNAAIAVRDLKAGTRFRAGDATGTLSHDVLEGHRFAAAPIAAGELVTSWHLPFGRALRRIDPGEYLCNATVLDALRIRDVSFDLPRIPNFQNAAATFELDEDGFVPGRQVARVDVPGTFTGYPRAGGRGSGTRNVVVVLGTSSQTASFARRLEAKLENDTAGYANIDGVAAVTHTEGGEGRDGREPNNLEFVLRTLAGFCVHANVAAFLAIDEASGFVDNARLERFLVEHGYPLEHVPHRFHTLARDLEHSLDECAEIVRGFYAGANAARRESRPLAELKIALQCGGSDAFSGVSGNPLAARVARELIRHGGAACLAETDELIGAERYVLANVRDLDTARRFLERIGIFRERLGWHGHSAEGNPSGGNQFRGLYNLSLKSIGAARKKDPDVRLDHVIEYAERMCEPGFHFMDSPGNDLESIAGQVASGCNLIFFITGNGSITNFPFVPTLKFVTTTRRFELLAIDMDVNAGRYQDGEPLDELANETFGLAIDVASGRRTAGERAGHSQVSIWRDWRQSDAARLESLSRRTRPAGRPIAIRGAAPAAAARAAPGDAPKLGLIVPTSLCSGQIALRIAEHLNTEVLPATTAVARFVALPHTEGCGASGGDNEEHLLRTLIGHLLHPAVGPALLLEHGCEKTHNDFMRHAIAEHGIDPARFGYASIQLDGGIDGVTARVRRWFEARLDAADVPPADATDGAAITLGLTSDGAVPDASARVLAMLATRLVAGGATVIVPQAASLLASTTFLAELGLDTVPGASIDYAQRARMPGFHVMATPGTHFVEAVTGLGGTGIRTLLAHVCGGAMQGHPMIPTLQIATANGDTLPHAADLDLVLDPAADPGAAVAALCSRVTDTHAGRYRPAAWSRGHTDFQVTRGQLGISL